MTVEHARLVDFLVKLRVVGLKQHKISHAAMMVAGNTLVKPDWIPIPSIDIHAHFIEIVSLRRKGL